MRVIIAGSRDIEDYDLLCQTVIESGFRITEVDNVEYDEELKRDEDIGTGVVRAPWNQAHVDALNFYQDIGVSHPYTCGSSECRANLLATADGWICPSCGYTQDWSLRVSSVVSQAEYAIAVYPHRIFKSLVEKSPELKELYGDKA